MLHVEASWIRWLDRAAVGRRAWWLLTGFCLMIWLPGFFTLPPSDRDESRFAQATRQMLESGNYEQIRIGQVERYQKPIGIYWLQIPFAAAARSAGIARQNPIWPYRVPSLLGGIIAVLATYGFGRIFIGARAAFLGAALLAESAILTFEVHMAKTDAALLATTTILMGLLSRAYLKPEELAIAPAMAFWVALAASILIKGPIAPMIVALAVLVLSSLGARTGPPRWLLALRPATGVWLLLALVLPWFIAIEWVTQGRFFAQSVGTDLARKLSGGDQAHGAMLGTHLLMLPLLLLSGGVAVVGGAPSIWRARKQPEVRFLLAWIVPSWIVFECIATKLPHYTLPLYPALALLAARWISQPAEADRSTDTRLLCVLAALVIAVIGLVASILPLVIEPNLNISDLLGLPTLAIAVAAVALLIRAWPDGRCGVVIMFCATPFLLGSVLGIELPLLTPLWIAPKVANQLHAYWPNGFDASAFGELGFAEPSLIFECGTNIHLLKDSPAAVAFMEAGQNPVIAVGDHDLRYFLPLVNAAGLNLKVLSRVSGYNYSRGRRLTLTLYAKNNAAQRIK